MRDKLHHKDHPETLESTHERPRRRHRAEKGEGHPRRGHHHHASRHNPTKMRLKRLFERGDLQLLILTQLKQTTSHGYELIKSIGHLTHGLYEPSPGVVYPTLAMLEDQGLIQPETTEANKKAYAITPDGLLHLQQHEPRLAVLNERLSSINDTPEDLNFSKPLEEAIKNFKMLMRHKLRHDTLSPQQIEEIVAILNRATQEINQVNHNAE